MSEIEEKIQEIVNNSGEGYLTPRMKVKALKHLISEELKRIIMEAKPEEQKEDESEDCMSVKNIRSEAYNWGVNDYEFNLRKRKEELLG